MALTVLDHLTPSRRGRFAEFLAGPGDPYIYELHVGAGWAYAKLPWLRLRIASAIRELDPMLRWLALDGFGCHEGFFRWPRTGDRQRIPRAIHGYARRAFDQGLGRSLWFVDGGDVARVRQTIADFPENRQGDLWSGIGLASVYAGEVNETALRVLRDASGAFLPQLAQGAAFAAKARCRAGNPTAYTERACRALCGVSATDAAAVTDAALENLPASELEPAFEVWRRRIQEKFAQGKELKR